MTYFGTGEHGDKDTRRTTCRPARQGGRELFNPAMSDVELLTPPPIGLDAQFRARMGKAGMVMLVELTEFDRRRRLGSRRTSSMMETSGALGFTADSGGTVMSWAWQVHPKGWLRTLAPPNQSNRPPAGRE